MTVSFQETLVQLRGWLRQIVQALIVLSAFALTGTTVAMAFGLLPWAEMSLRFGDQTVPNAGMWAQIGLTFLLWSHVFYLPANLRMVRLERSHRSFAVGIEDVARAYRVAHAAARTEVFALSGEFESMRARVEHLRQHPNLDHLEPELLNLAAQMSFLSRDLAQTCSDTKVARARSFLKSRVRAIF